MTQVKLFNQKGESAGTVDLDPAVFDVPMREALVHQIVVAQQANARPVIAHTKTRGEVRGGGRKPWRQKGTGRARHGSTRSPIWVGGGVTFGPRKDHNVTKGVNRKARRKALLMVLSDKARHDRIVALDELAPTEFRTKTFTELVKKLPVRRRVLFVMPKADTKVSKSVANVPLLDAIRADSLNVLDVLRADYLVFARESFDRVKATFAKARKD
ncbi:MAG: 50S ribosomal protein L4 [Candidatus Kerfeldbacteria bacterium]|nr:50S ribosomal protein L4 [Candidatus Kerfeldbacteria bacterium]